MFKNDASARPEIDITGPCSYFEPHMVAFAISVSGKLQTMRTKGRIANIAQGGPETLEMGWLARDSKRGTHIPAPTRKRV
jgi:hypothetical protein